MPTKKAINAARRDKSAGKSPSVQAGEFVKEEIHKIRRGQHGARSAKQAIAIGLSQARRAGVDLPPPKKGKVSEKSRAAAKAAYDAGHGRPHGTSSRKRSRATTAALKRESTQAASHTALSRHARAAAAARTQAERSESAKQAVRTKGFRGRRDAAHKAALTRASHGH